MFLDNKNNKTIIFLNFILIQLFIIVTSTLYQYLINIKSPVIKSTSTVNVYGALLGFSIISSIITISSFNGIIKLMKKETELNIAENRLKDSQEMVQVLRANQHDFINHLQVIYGAAQLGKLDEANEYFHGIVKQVKELETVSRLAYPEISVLLYSKIVKAEELSAKVSVNINTDLKKMRISPIDLSRILGNLLDNAIYAIKDVDQEKRELVIKLNENQAGLEFTIFNRYPIIPESIQEKIFEAGYTTKGEAGSGLGLHNVKELVAKNHGTVKVISKVDEGTSFIVNIDTIN